MDQIYPQLTGDSLNGGELLLQETTSPIVSSCQSRYCDDSCVSLVASSSDAFALPKVTCRTKSQHDRKCSSRGPRYVSTRLNGLCEERGWQILSNNHRVGIGFNRDLTWDFHEAKETQPPTLESLFSVLDERYRNSWLGRTAVTSSHGWYLEHTKRTPVSV